jgi:hypothetical protein
MFCDVGVVWPRVENINPVSPNTSRQHCICFNLFSEVYLLNFLL